MLIKATAPMRADLAGGTLDIFPLHVFMHRAVSVNVSLTLASEVTIEPRTDGRIVIISDDLKTEQSAPDAASLDPDGPLGFLARIVRFYPPSQGMAMHTKNNVPKGSGLGASSTLLIAVSHALQALNGTSHTKDQLIDMGCNIEAEFIQVPAGKQDHFGATYGGLSAIHFEHTGNRHERISDDEDFLCDLDARLVFTFAGAPRFSGGSNWNMFKAYVDGDKQARENLDTIKRIADHMLAALRARDLDAFARLLDEEWQHRRNIAPGVSTPQIEKMMDAARGAGALASKICGAGGGGCMVTVAPPEKRAAVQRALSEAGAMVLDCNIARTGVTVSSE
jgi:D-glycero-alpha-D-manno-heptose-7-phosphate kinase